MIFLTGLGEGLGILQGVRIRVRRKGGVGAERSKPTSETGQSLSLCSGSLEQSESIDKEVFCLYIGGLKDDHPPADLLLTRGLAEIKDKHEARRNSTSLKEPLGWIGEDDVEV